MHSEKEYIVKIRKLTIALKKSSEKVDRLNKTTKDLRQQLKYKTRRLKEVTLGRTKWKERSVDKSQIISNLKNKLTREKRIKRHHFSYSIMKLCILLRLQGGCSYRKVIAVLKVLSVCSLIDLGRFPCANTVQNWVSKIGLFELQNTDNELIGKEVVLILDESIRLGNEKHLLVLSTPYNQENEGALTMEDVKVVYFGSQASWTGDTIQAELAKIEVKFGLKVKAILSDEDSKLKRASRLNGTPHLSDICHAIGTCLKKTFKKNIDYQSFIKELSQYRSKGVNRSLSYLLPPNQRAKARFINQSAIVNWAEKLLERFDKLSDTESDFFKALPTHSLVIAALKSCLLVAKEISLLLKTNGLSKGLLKMIRTRILVLIKLQVSNEEGFLRIFLTHLDKYIIDYQCFMEQQKEKRIPVSSEIIESLFGKYKQLVSPNKLTGTTKLNLEIPAHCINEIDTKYDLAQALETIFMTNIDEWVEQHSSVNQLVMRRKFFGNGT